MKMVPRRCLRPPDGQLASEMTRFSSPATLPPTCLVSSYQVLVTSDMFRANILDLLISNILGVYSLSRSEKLVTCVNEVLAFLLFRAYLILHCSVPGVADGVGGWRNYGVDPSLFSSSLMATCQNAVIEGRSRPEAPKTIIATGYHDLIQRTRTSFSTGRR